MKTIVSIVALALLTALPVASAAAASDSAGDENAPLCDVDPYTPITDWAWFFTWDCVGKILTITFDQCDDVREEIDGKSCLAIPETA